MDVDIQSSMIIQKRILERVNSFVLITKFKITNKTGTFFRARPACYVLALEHRRGLLVQCLVRAPWTAFLIRDFRVFSICIYSQTWHGFRDPEDCAILLRHTHWLFGYLIYLADYWHWLHNIFCPVHMILAVCIFLWVLKLWNYLVFF